MSADQTKPASVATGATTSAGPTSGQPIGNIGLMRHLLQPGFVIVALILLVCAIGLNAAVTSMKLSFQKKPVELTVFGKELTQLPMDLGPWKMVSHDGRLNVDVEDALGTQQYVFRDYVDERLVGAEMVQRLREMDEMQCRRALTDMQMRDPRATISLAVTYYTGLVDTVAHIPDRCYIADGYQPTEYVVKTWPTQPDETNARFITFEDQTGFGKMARNVAYFFFVNGQQTSDPLGVRVALQNLTEEYGYYSKVELMVAQAKPAVAEAVMADFLGFAKPEIVQCLPDWQKVLASSKDKK